MQDRIQVLLVCPQDNANLVRFKQSIFPRQAVGIEFASKEIDNMKYNIWDVRINDRFGLNRKYYSKNKDAILFFDVDPQQQEDIRKETGNPNCVCIDFDPANPNINNYF